MTSSPLPLFAALLVGAVDEPTPWYVSRPDENAKKEARRLQIRAELDKLPPPPLPEPLPPITLSLHPQQSPAVLHVEEIGLARNSLDLVKSFFTLEPGDPPLLVRLPVAGLVVLYLASQALRFSRWAFSKGVLKR